MNEYLKVFIVEDEPFWQNMITRQLNMFPDFLIVGIAEYVEQAIEMGNLIDYDIILIDLHLGKTVEDGFQVYNELKKTKDIQAIFLTGDDDPKRMYNAFLLGVFSYIPKTHLNVLPQTIRYLYENPVPNIFMNAVYNKIKEFRLYDLTFSEKNVFDLLRQGLKPKEISTSLNITLYTVRSHIRNVLKKLEVKNYRDALKKLYSNNEIASSDE